MNTLKNYNRSGEKLVNLNPPPADQRVAHKDL